MDFNDKDINSDMWEWQEEEYCLETDSRNGISQCLWDNVNVNEDSLMYILDEQTPIKDCADFGYQDHNVVDNVNKGMEECIETSQMKRRRMLQFTSDANELAIDDDEFTSICLKSKVRESSVIDGGLVNNSQLNSEWNTGYHGWDQASEGWLANCLNESEMHCTLNEMDNCVLSDDQLDVPDAYNTSLEMDASLEMETDILQERPNPSPIKIIKGRKKSFLKPPKKLVSGVVYPFALIKPCGVKGDVTLKDINQHIHAPPPSSKQKMDEDSSLSYPTSAFSGKPVVLKTKIHTEGGRGSITIMRTKG